MSSGHEGLWWTFKEWWPAWVDHAERWEPRGDGSITVIFREDGYMTSGKEYVFGRKADGSYFLNMTKKEEVINEAGGNP